MKLNFADRLLERVAALNNPTCLGLDPQLDYVPSFIREKALQQAVSAEVAQALALERFNCELLEALKGLVPVVKFQLAMYEQFGSEGLKALERSHAFARSLGYITIADAKRNDIGNTAEAYSRAFLGKTRCIDGQERAFFDADAVTLNAYLGIDGIKPFLQTMATEGKGCFILVRTSNPSAGDLQDLPLADGRKVYEAMADLVHQWGQELVGTNGYSSAGVVVGATWPEQAAALRERMPQQIFLIPGYGAQGGAADDAVSGFARDGRGGIINASRSLMCAAKRAGRPEDDFVKAALDEAKAMQKALNEALAKRR